MHVVVIGAGAMGCRFGAALSRAGASVYLYDVNKAHVDAINERGLLIHEKGETKALKISAYTDIKNVPACELTILFTKSIYTDAALEAAAPILKEGTRVLTLQNGLGNIEAIEKYVPRRNVIAGITNYATDLLGPGEVEFTGDGIAKLMPLDEGGRDFAAEVAGLLSEGGCNTQMSDDVMVDIWEKVAFNAAYNGLTCITELTVGGVGSTEEGRSLCLDIASDVVRVANAEGVSAEEKRVHETILSVIGPHKDHKPSMLQDREAKRRTEADAILGAVVQKGDRHKISCEYVRTVYRIIRMIENAYLNN